MHLDVLELHSFYYRTGLGRAAQRAIRDRLEELWPPQEGLSVAGFGFAVPLLRPYLATSRRVVGLMPEQQGVMPWPAGMPNVSVLCAETLWPLDADAVDRLVLLHGLETSEHPSALLAECWRVLAPEGRVLFIVPNRAGLWARRDVTPFGFGRPYSLGQLEGLMERHGFVAERYLAALFTPPSHQRFWLRTGPFWENAGRKLSRHYAGGVLMVEAKKQVLDPLRPGLPETAKRPLRVREGIVVPDPAPV